MLGGTDIGTCGISCVLDGTDCAWQLWCMVFVGRNYLRVTFIVQNLLDINDRQ